jgi:ubiquinone/menaquinone biosynthesis C-methylase UbiE
LPSIEENKLTWNDPATWDKFNGGNSWSGSWGDPSNQWIHTVMPRIRTYVPTGTILEIAPGFGRWTYYLKDLCKHLIVVDLNELCIQKCRERFSSSTNITYYLNNGKDLSMIEDGSIDFAFSFDSLVHVEEDVMAAYLTQLAKKLKPNGVGWLHHSNVGAYRRLFENRKNFRVLSFGFSKIFGFESNFRAWSMTAQKFENLAQQAGMVTISQEMVNWASKPRYLIDCISVCTPKGSARVGPNRKFANSHFMDEATYSRKLGEIYRSR